MYTYQISKGTTTDETGKKHIVYGIEMLKDHQLVRAIHDVFCEREQASALCELCRTLALSPIHLEDVIADAIAG